MLISDDDLNFLDFPLRLKHTLNRCNMMIIKNIGYLSLHLLILNSAIFYTPLAIAKTSLIQSSQNDQKQWVGQVAPSYKLQDQNGKWHQSKDTRGKWTVLYFYPKDNTAGCTEEAKQFKNLYPQFLKANAVVLGVSLDDVKSHQAFSKKLGLPFPILADHQHQLADQFGIVRNFGITKVAKRESFLIDPQGTIVYHYTSVNSQTHAKQVLNDILKFQKK